MSDTAETHAKTFERLVEARTTIDRLIIRNAVLEEKIRCQNEEFEALRKMLSFVATGGRVVAL